MKKVIMLLSNPFKPDPRVYKEAKSLVTNGYNVTILAWDLEGKYLKKEVIDGIKIERIQLKSHHGSFLQFAPIFLVWNILVFSKLLFRKFDIIHCHDFDTLPLGFLTGRLKGKKIIYDAHENYPDMIKEKIPLFIYNLITKMESYYIKRINFLITVNNILEEYFMGLDSPNNKTIMNCYNKRDFEIYPEKIVKITNNSSLKNKFIVLYIGILIKDRGLEELVESFRYQKDDSIVLLIFGYGQIEKNLKEIVKKYRLENKVFLLGEIHPSMIPSYTSIGHLIPIIYKYNENNKFSSPNKLFEAITLNKPVLVSDVGILGKIVREFDCGIILENFNPEKIAETLEKIKNNPHLLEKMKENADKAYEKYNWKNMEERMLEVYEEVLK